MKYLSLLSILSFISAFNCSPVVPITPSANSSPAVPAVKSAADELTEQVRALGIKTQQVAAYDKFAQEFTDALSPSYSSSQSNKAERCTHVKMADEFLRYGKENLKESSEDYKTHLKISRIFLIASMWNENGACDNPLLPSSAELKGLLPELPPGTKTENASLDDINSMIKSFDKQVVDGQVQVSNQEKYANGLSIEAQLMKLGVRLD